MLALSYLCSQVRACQIALVKVANTCCNVRVVSILKGGYKIHGGIVLTFARTIPSHIRALVDSDNICEEYDIEEGDWESFL